MNAQDWAIVALVVIGIWVCAFVANVNETKDLPGAAAWATFITPVCVVVLAALLGVFVGIVWLLKTATGA